MNKPREYWKRDGKVIKNKIPYQYVDIHIVTLVKTFNKLPFLATLGSCEGHPRQKNTSYWSAQGGLMIEIYNQKALKDFILPLLLRFQELDYSLSLSKTYNATEDGFMNSWELEWYVSANTEEACKVYLRDVWRAIQKYVDGYIAKS